MLSIEVFRPDEMVLIVNQKKNRSSLKKMVKSKQPDNPYIRSDPEDSESDGEVEEDDHHNSKKKWLKDLIKKKNHRRETKKLMTIDEKIRK